MSNRVQSIQQGITGKMVIILLLVQFILQFIIVLGTGAHVQQLAGEGILDLRFHYTAVDVEQLLGAGGEAGREAYTLNQVIDMFFVICYATAYTALYIYSSTRIWRAGHMMRKLWFIPVLVGMADIVENISIFSLLSSYPALSDATAGLAVAFTMTKHILTVVFLGLLLIAGIGWIMKKRTASRGKLQA
ncbi:hypothetical protein M6D81_01870 [Paenibacillus sp. J5C_2022]|uniref:hypothetical protein n=1 Tax=Paenibacillus sp. J5C2022 TaxID=2977129 RepID=UPI0021CF93F8|nr:hypothetical protein [Paenibacillus sp. J5C2022]MCU6707444.1 hypothetical protein [Paenibacillus sp. J5C2022]